ncbi:amidase family protein [Pseudomonas serbica]
MFSKKNLRQTLEQSASIRMGASHPFCKEIDWADNYHVFVNRIPVGPESDFPVHAALKRWGGVLSGINYIVKDSIDVAGFPTTNGTLALNSNYPSVDNSLVARLRSLGAMCIGKANLDEMSYGWSSDNPYFGRVVNPAYPHHSPGGSSGGCAAGVAGGAAYFAVGEDTVGSLRIPAAFCGVSAYRAPHPGFATDGVCPLTSSGYDQLGLIANNLDDISLLDSLIHEYEELPAVEPINLHIAVAANFSLAALMPSIEESMYEAIFKLSAAGAHIVMQEVPASFELAAHALATIVNHELLTAFNRYLGSRSQGPATLEDLLQNRDTSAANKIKALAFPPGRPSLPVYERAQAVAGKIKQDVVDYFKTSKCQVLIHPTVGITAPAINHRNEFSTDQLVLARHVSVATCAKTVAMNFSVMGPDALPVGIEMLCSPAIDHQHVLAICRTIETIVKG